jgi:hypothetical protein
MAPAWSWEYCGGYENARHCTPGTFFAATAAAEKRREDAEAQLALALEKIIEALIGRS